MAKNLTSPATNPRTKGQVKYTSRGFVSVYSMKFKLHCVALYREHNSTIKVLKYIQREFKAGKWSYDNQPTPTTILRWVDKYDPSYEDESEDMDPVKRTDLEMLGIIRVIQNSARKSLKNLRFKDMREVIAALAFCNTTRRGLVELYKGDRKILNKGDKVARQLRIAHRTSKEAAKDVAIRTKDAIDFMKEREKRQAG